MTNITDFLKNALQDMVIEFPKMIIQYEFFGFGNNHHIKIAPQSILDNSKVQASIKKLRIALHENYSNHIVAFFNENSIYQIENPTFTLQGADYQKELAFSFLSNSSIQPYFTNDNQDFMEAFQWQDMGLANCAA